MCKLLVQFIAGAGIFGVVADKAWDMFRQNKSERVLQVVGKKKGYIAEGQRCRKIDAKNESMAAENELLASIDQIIAVLGKKLIGFQFEEKCETKPPIIETGTIAQDREV